MKPDRSYSASLLLVISALIWIAPDAQATTVLDQEYLVSNDALALFSQATRPGFRRAETFTVGVTGTLNEIVVVNRNPGVLFTGLNILSTSDGVPTTMIVATGEFLFEFGREDMFVAMEAFSVSLPVSVGDVLAIEPIVAGNGFSGFWRANQPGTYIGGGDYFVNSDLGINVFTPSGNADNFLTFVEVPETHIPEPPSLWLFGAALLWAWARVAFGPQQKSDSAAWTPSARKPSPPLSAPSGPSAGLQLHRCLPGPYRLLAESPANPPLKSLKNVTTFNQ
jgi:hypothetical protein